MSTTQFRLNKGKQITDKTKPHPIYIRYKVGRKVDFNASIKERVLFDEWDVKRQRVKNRTTIKNRVSINNLIKNLTNHFETFDSKNLETGTVPSYDDVKNHFKTFFIEPETNTQPTIFEYFDEFINRPENQRQLSSGTIKSYQLTKTFLKRFNDECQKFDFESINLNWYNDFIEWCEDQNLSTNYIGKHIKVLKSLLNDAYDNGVTTNTDYRHKKFKILKEDVENIYLTEDELTKMWQFNLDNHPNHQRARDLFLIGAYTGLRVSDYGNLTEQNIKKVQGQEILKVTTKKTGRVVAIPLHPIVKSILKRYDNQPPEKMLPQRINLLIKDVANWCGIDSTEYITITRGGRKITKKVIKSELVKTHTARRSFCTNAYLKGMSSLDLMSISGHTSESSFLKYIKVTPEERAVKMANHDFFKTALKVV